MSLSDIFNGAVQYVRANPKATLGLTTIVVVATQLISLALKVGPLAATGRLDQLTRLPGEAVFGADLAGSVLVNAIDGMTAGLSAILLSGMLTVVIGRAVFGSTITIGQAWERLRPRLLTLIGLTVLEVIGAAVLLGAPIVVIAVGARVNGALAVVAGAPVIIGVLVALVYLATMLSFAPALIVLERLPLTAAVARSFALIRRSFWRVFGIWLAAIVVVWVVTGAVSVPFQVAGMLFGLDATSTLQALVAGTLVMIGSVIGQIVTAPFSAGVIVLLYTDRRIRAEAFDLVLRTGAAYVPGHPADYIDQLWLTRHL